MHLHYLHLPNLTPYLRASTVQSQLLIPHLQRKAIPHPLRRAHKPPPPTLLTFQTPPTYTCGRREIGTLSPSQISHLECSGAAEFHEAFRGGQTTFHGPGQLTAYLILSLDAHGLSVRSYVRLLESAIIDTCAVYGIGGFTTENPGVWTSAGDKIASVGVHLRRGIASHGIGLNVSTDLGWFERIVACGLVGKRATSFEREGVKGKGVEEVGRVFAERVRARLKYVDEVEAVSEAYILGTGASLERKDEMKDEMKDD